MPMRALKDALSVSAQNVSVMVDGLEGLGLVTRGHHPEDRRVVLVKLTPVGMERVDAGLAAHQRSVSSLFDCLSDEQKQLLDVCLGRLCDELDSRHVR
jgi:DNA-binding MarR family transcriptional regulator